MSLYRPTRRQIIKTSIAAAALAPLAAPHLANAQAATLRITGWGGRWSDTMKATVIPAFEAAARCKIEMDSAFPFIPKLQASARNAPIYDVLHTNANEQWGAFAQGLVIDKILAKDVPNIKDLHPYATSDKVVGVTMFSNAIGLVYRTDKGITVPTSWKDFADRRHDGQRGTQSILVGTFGQAHLMMLGKIYGKGFQDLDAAYRALEQLKPMKIVDFAGQMERMLLASEVSIALLHEAGCYRNEGQPLEFCAPAEGTLALEQVLSVTPGSKVKELAYAFIDHMLKPENQKLLGEAMWYGPTNKLTTLDAKFSKLPVSPAQVASLTQFDWKWYNEQKDAIDARVARILRG